MRGTAAAAAALLSHWVAGTVAQLSTQTRMIQGGQCGEAALACPDNIPGCDIDLLASYAVQMISGLELGTCADVGYTVAVGQTTSGDCPGTRCVDVMLYAPTGALICDAAQIAPLTTACAPFTTIDDTQICGSPCEAEARSLMGSASCFVPGEIHMMLDSVTASCAGYVPVGESYACNRGLYFEAYYDSSADEALDFGWSSLRGAAFNFWTPQVEHAERMPDLDFENDEAFVAEIDGFEQLDSYLMRWRGTFTADAEGFYAFSTTSDDGSMLYIDGEIIVDNDGLHGAQTRQGAVTLTEGDHAIVIAFFENGGGARLRVTVTPPGGDEQVLSSRMLSNPFGCGDDQGETVGIDERCAIDYCEDLRNCPRCTPGLSCEGADEMACAGTCFGRCVAPQPPGCSTCNELHWPTGGNSVCAESDPQNMPGWSSCVNELTHADAEEHCLSVGARLCTAAELFENGEGQGTGCGHDNRLIWSSSTELHSGGVDLSCSSDYERLVIPGNMASAATRHLAPACTNVQELGAALRCCADAVCTDMEAAPNLTELAQSVEALSTLVRALLSAGLTDTLAGPGPFTVFAPSNDAFEALGQATVDDLLADHDRLLGTLQYHIVAGQVLASDLSSGMRLATVQGQPLTVRLKSGRPATIVAAQSRANVVQADVQASNGVVHVIDAVLLPPDTPLCATCGALGWDPHGDEVCAESDDGFDCQTGLDFSAAKSACEAFGARLCTADELLASEGQGTGCGHDSRYVWSSSSASSAVGEACAGWGREHVAVLGNPSRATELGQAVALCKASSGDGGASLRCCADTACQPIGSSGH